MSTTIDQRVVEMRFDNRQFENNVSTTMSTLDKFKQKLNFAGVAKGLENVNTVARGMDMGVLGSAVETVQAKFSALGVIGVTALANITNSAVNTGKRIISALTIDPIKMGFSEYELKMGSIQTIMSSTGESIDVVNGYLNELNEYSDRTIYSFSDMTQNIGKFTNAGVKLEDAVLAIKGISNEAAVSGANAGEASRAMYNFAQALSAGYVKLMDWKSIENANMATVEFKQQLIDAAVAAGTLKEASDGMYETLEGTTINATKNFNESLQDQWMTTEVLVNTLKDYADETTDIGKKAFAAAQDVKTFSQLYDTLKESAQSGWAQTWEILVGNLEEAKETLTEISKVIGGVLDASAKARNDLLQGWKDAGGRADLVESLFNVITAIGTMVAPIKEAFREIFPPLTVKNLTDFTANLKTFTANLSLSSETADKVKRIFKGIFSIFDIGKKVLTSVADALLSLAGSKGISSLANSLLDIAASLGDFFTSLNAGFDSGGLTGFLSSIASGISNLIEGSIGPIKGFADAVGAVGKFVVGVVHSIWDAVEPVFTWIRENVSVGDIFAGLAGGGIFVAAKKLAGFLDNIIDTIKGLFDKGEKGPGIMEQFGEMLGSAKEALNSFSTGIKIGSIVAVAVAVGILSASMRSISEIDTKGVIKSLTSIGVMMTMLSVVFKSITKTLDGFKPKGLIKAGFSLILIASAVGILAKAMKKMSEMSLKDIGKSLVGVGGGLIALAAGLKIIGRTKVSLKSSVAMLALAASCNILGDAMQKFAKLSWDEIGRGLSAMGGALAELVASVSVLQKFGGFKSLLSSLGIAIIIQSLDELAEGLKKFGEMSWGEIGRGLSAMGGALGELSIVLGGLGKFAGFSSIFAAGAISSVVQGLDELAEGLKIFGTMSWDEIGRGLSAMGGALGEISITLGALGKFAGFSSIFASGAITIIIDGLDDLAAALKSFSEMSWDEIGRGLSSMGGALAEVAVISGAMGYLSGIAGLFGAGTIWIATQGLNDLANSFQKFGEMSWDEIGRGLVAMGGALAEVAIVSGATGALSGIAGLVGAGTITLAVQGLDELANGLKKFGEMSWDEIGRGLSAMGGALGEVALGGLLSTFSGLGALSITAIADSLGDLADGVKKWTNVDVPDGLGLKLAALSDGVKEFTFAGAGSAALSESAAAVGVLADSVKKWTDVTIPEGLGDKFNSLATAVRKFWDAGIGAGALADSAKPVGDLADSVKKWKDVTVPENIETDLTAIANGVKAFTFAFAGGWSIGSITSVLSELPGAINAWKDVTVPENIETDLRSIANGVQAFSFAFAGGWSIETVIGPLNSLPDAISKWNGITIPEGLGESLKSLANGVSAFSGMGDVSAATSSVGALVTAMKNLSAISFQTINSGIVGLSSTISNFASIGSQMAGSLASGLSAGVGNVQSSMTTVVNIAFTTATTATSMFTEVGGSWIQAVADAINSLSGQVESATTSVAGSGVTGARSKYTDFYLAGSYCVTGYVNGITWNTWKATNAGEALAEAALEAAKRRLDENSPSKEFYEVGAFGGEGFVNALTDYVDVAYKASSKMAGSAKEGLVDTMSDVARSISNTVDSQPTIRPVLDLSQIQNGANQINGLFASRTVSLAGINSNLSANRSNPLYEAMIDMRDINDSGNSEIVTAIFGLKSDFNKLAKAVENMQLTLDGEAVVGGIAKKMDRSLGRIASYKGRGN